MRKTILPFVTQYNPLAPTAQKGFNEQMAYHWEKNPVSRDFSGTTQYLLQKRQISKRYTRYNKKVKLIIYNITKPAGVVSGLSHFKHQCLTTNPGGASRGSGAFVSKTRQCPYPACSRGFPGGIPGVNPRESQ